MTNETKILCKQRLGGYLGIGDHLTVEPLDIWCQTTQLHGGWEPCGKMIAYIYTGVWGLSMRPSSTTSCKQHHPVHNNYPDHPKSQEKVEACVASSHYIWGALLCLLRKTEAYRSSLRSSAQVECCEAHTMHGLQIWGPSILLPTFFLLHPQRLADRCIQPIAHRPPHEAEDNYEFSSSKIINILKILCVLCVCTWFFFAGWGQSSQEWSV